MRSGKNRVSLSKSRSSSASFSRNNSPGNSKSFLNPAIQYLNEEIWFPNVTQVDQSKPVPLSVQRRPKSRAYCTQSQSSFFKTQTTSKSRNN